MRTVRFSAGDTILSEGDDGNTAFLIVDGTVEVSIGFGARARSVGSLEAGDVFGEMSLIEPGPRSATIKALSDTECVVTTYDEFIAGIQNNPERAIEFMKTLVRRLRHMNQLLEQVDPAKRGLRGLLRDLRDSYEGADAARRDVEKMHPMF